MSFKKQSKVTKMSLNDFNKLDTPKKDSFRAKYPVIEQQVERAPVVSLASIMEDQDTNVSVPVKPVKVLKSNKKFVKGQRLDLDVCYGTDYERSTFETERLTTNEEFDLRTLRQQRSKEDDRLKH